MNQRKREGRLMIKFQFQCQLFGEQTYIGEYITIFVLTSFFVNRSITSQSTTRTTQNTTMELWVEDYFRSRRIQHNVMEVGTNIGIQLIKRLIKVAENFGTIDWN